MVKRDFDMEDRDKLPGPDPKPSLPEVLTDVKATEEPPTAPHPRPPLEQTPSLRTEARPPRIERRNDPILQPSDSEVVLEQVTSWQPYEVSYACLLIPRFSSHHLMGDIEASLREWMRDICVSCGWRLDKMLVRPEYMQWVLYVPATAMPSSWIRTIRVQTSRRIFEDFPDFRRENISQDFWAPGYLVLVGSALHPNEMINEYIRLTRQQQGIQPRSSV